MDLPDTYFFDLEHLLNIASLKSIPLQSKISRAVVYSDILAWNSELDVFNNKRAVLQSEDPLTRNLALEVGVDCTLFPNENPQNYKRPASFLEKVRKWLQAQGIHEEYLGNICLLSAVVAVLYERKLRTPELFWHRHSCNSNIFLSSLDDFRRLISKYKDDFPDESRDVESGAAIFRQTVSKHRRSGFIWETQLSYKSDFLPVFIYQKIEHLLALAQSLPAQRVYFQTRVGLIDYLNQICSDPELRDYCLGFLSEIHEESYPGRSELVHKVYQLPMKFRIIPSYIENVSRAHLLAIPPVWYEEDYFQILLSSNSLGMLYRKLKEAFPLLEDLSDIKYAVPLAREIFRSMNSDPEIQPKSRAELAQMVDSKIFRRIPPKVLYSLTGWKGLVYLFNMREEIRDCLRRQDFHLISDVRICPNPEDFHLEPHKNFVISFGTFTDFVCYSPEDLIQSFRVDENFVAFRRPDRPNEAFSEDEIDSLLNILKEEDPNWTLGYAERTRPLIEMIEEGLSTEQPIVLEIITEQIFNLNSQDRQQAEIIFRSFFEAGMFQRTWSGTGEYPLKYTETTGQTLEEIEIRMTPALNRIREAFDKLSEEGQKLISSLAVIDYMDNNFVRRVDPLLSFESQTRKGEFCIGYGGRLMIYSGYFYLSALGVDIPGFQLDKFDPESTHR